MHRLTIFAYIFHFFPPVQVNKHGRLNHAKIHSRHKALPAREQLRLTSIIVEKKQYFFDGIRNMILKRSWFHELSRFSKLQYDLVLLCPLHTWTDLVQISKKLATTLSRRMKFYIAFEHHQPLL